MTKFEEELMATAKMIPTSDGNEIKFKTSSALYDYLLLSNGEAELYLQQQALPVVPECVGEYIERCKSYDCGLIWAIRPDRDANDNSEKVYDWLFPNGVKLPNGMYPNPYEPDNLVRPDKENQIKFVRAWLDGYTVEKPQLFRLKLKNTTISNYYLWLNHATGKVFVDKKYLDWTNHNNVKNTFKEQEIAKISDGAFVNNEAFELVPVEDGE